MKIPKKVFIGPYQYDVVTGPKWIEWAEELANDGSHLDGYISPRNLRIVVNTSAAHPDNARYVLLHEIVHGLLDVTGYGQEWERRYGNEEYEEKFTAAFSAALFAMLRHNGQVVDYLVAE